MSSEITCKIYAAGGVILLVGLDTALIPGAESICSSQEHPLNESP